VVVGLCIELLVLVLSSTWHWVTFIRDGDWTLDAMIRAVSAAPRLIALRPANVPNLVFVDVDEATWRDPRWGGGEPFRAPRERLLELINQVLARGAQYVDVDVLMEGPPSDTETRDFAKGLERLLPVLRASSSNGAPRHLILNRSLRPRLDQAGGVYATLPELSPSPVDAVVSRSEGLIASAAPYFVQSSDGVLREWSFWSPACQGTAPGRAVVIPSVQMLITVWSRSRGDGASWAPPSEAACPRPEDAQSVMLTKNDLSRQTFSWLKQTGSITNLKRAEVRAAQLDEALQNVPRPPLPNRIVYRIFDRSANPDAQGLPATPGFARLSARELLDVPPSQPAPWGRLLSGAIVVIGQSNSAAGDMHVTPLGPMIGSLVVVNSIDSALRYGFLRPVPELSLHIPLTIVFVAFTAAVSAFFEGALWSLLAGLVVLVITFFLSVSLFVLGGVWLDFTGPVLGTIVGVVWDGYRSKRHEGALAWDKAA
jgi:CHASE2 domain-containing sensor protein